MYSTCLFCHAGLRANVAIERLPIGRRLAFDTAKGRLWVVCPHCARWNLAPLEERWEAVEECEREFRRAQPRASTENIALATVRSGVDLVRVGKPKRAELEAWRFGRRILERRGMSAAATAARRFARRNRTFVRAADGSVLALNGEEVSRARLLPQPVGGEFAVQVRTEVGTVRLEGSAGLSALGPLLARVNQFGALAWEIEEALEYLERAGGAEAHIERTSRSSPELEGLRPVVLLSLEMAVAGHFEDGALAGTVRDLEAEWRRAEEIAEIADNLLLPPMIARWLQQHQRTG